MNKLTRREIISAVAAVWGRPVEAILGTSRAKENVEPRQAAAWIMVEYGGRSSSEAAMALGRDRTTIVHAKQAIRRRMRAGERELHRKITLVMDELGNPLNERARPPVASARVPAASREVMVPELDQVQVAKVMQLSERGWPLMAICRSRPELPERVVARLVGAA